MSEHSQVKSKAGPLEKVGHFVLRKMGPTCPDGGGTLEDQRVLTPEEQQELRAIVRWTVFRAGLVGALSAVAAAVAALYAEKYFSDDVVRYWLVFGGVSLLGAVIEVGFLYYDALRAVHRISRVSDVELFPEGEERSRMAGIMVRAAMELPNPPDRDPYVNPLRYASKWKILLGALVYKGKILVTNALAKVLIRKVLLRGAARAWLEFIAVPITAAWNAVICFWVLREARIRAMGPSAVAECLPEWLKDANPMVSEVAQRAVGVCVSASRDLHPNHLRMLEWLRVHHDVHVTEDTEDEDRFMQAVVTLEGVERQCVLDVLAMAIVIDGRMSRREREILGKITGVDQGPMLKQMLHQFRSGHGIFSLSGNCLSK